MAIKWLFAGVLLISPFSVAAKMVEYNIHSDLLRLPPKKNEWLARVETDSKQPELAASYKSFLKGLAVLELNQRVEIGLDKLKVQSYAPLDPLSTVGQMGSYKAKGYGLEFKIKLD